MLKNYLTITIRNLLKNKVYSFINISGLSIGITCFILIVLFVNDELTFDSHNKNADRIFRINSHYKIGDNRFNLANSPIPIADAVLSDYPEIEKAARVDNAGNVYVKKDNNFILEEKFFYADSTVFDIFSMDFVSGNFNTALTKPNSIVITSIIADKYFPDKNPMGERILLSDGKEFLITGVVKPVPQNTHFEFDFLASFNSLTENATTNWFGKFVHTYVLTKNGVTEKDLNDKIYSVTEKHVGPIVKEAFGVTYQDFLNSGNDFSFNFFPLKRIHLHSEVFNELKETGNINTIYLFSGIAFFILVIACINFVNLATARSSRRANEVGVRKALGSNKWQLIKQFLTESVLICFTAVILSLVIIELISPLFNQLTDKNLYIDYFGSAYILPALLLFTLTLGTAAGLYPALLLASFKPVTVLKGKVYKGSKKNILRKGLVIFQFSSSIILFIGTFIIYSQMKYIETKDLGFNKDQILIIKNMIDLGSQQFAFADNLKNNSNIINAALSESLPTFNLNANIFAKEGEKAGYTIVVMNVDHDFMETYKFHLKDGRTFSKNISTDTLSIILNESAVKDLNFKNPINSSLYANTGNEVQKINIIGVVKDFHLMSFKDKIRPAALMLMRNPSANYLSVKISSGKIKETINYIESQWNEFSQSKPFEYSFFDENIGEIYKPEIQAGKVFTIFAVLAIIIASLGLFGLTAFTAEQRTKEIGIRKVIGATVPDIVSMLSKEFLILVALSNIIAWPIAYYIMNKWLEDFVYKTDINLYVFILAGLIVLFTAMITVSYQSIKAATANPVKSLRYE